MSLYINTCLLQVSNKSVKILSGRRIILFTSRAGKGIINRYIHLQTDPDIEVLLHCCTHNYVQCCIHMCLSLVTLQPANDPHQMLLMLFLVIFFLTPIYMPVFECILLVHFKNSNKIGHTYSQISRVYCICIDFTWSSHEVIHNGVCKGMSYQKKAFKPNFTLIEIL